MPNVAWNPMWHHAPRTAREKIEHQGLIPGQGGGYGTGQSPLAYPKAVYLTSHPGLIGIPGSPGEEGAGIAGGDDIWEIDTTGLQPHPDWPAVVEHGAYAEPNGSFYFDEGANPKTDALHKAYGENLHTHMFENDPKPLMDLTGTAAYHEPISPERLKRIEWSDWLQRYGPQKHIGSQIPDDLKRLLDPGKSTEPDPGPIQWLWCYDPVENVVHIAHNEGRHPAYRITHKSHHPEITHENALRGFAFKIKGGWRIVDRDSKEIDDPYIIRAVVLALEGKSQPTPEPHPRYHGTVYP